MKKIFLLFVVFNCVVFIGITQQNNVKWPILTGDNGIMILVSDSLSFKEEFIPSEFYITADSLKPYTGYLHADYNGYGIDSSYVFNGKKFGISKEYRKSNCGDFILKYIKYFNYGLPKVYASRSFSNNSKYNLALIYYYEENDRKNINVTYKKTKIHVVEEYQGKSKKYKFTNRQELKEYIDKSSSKTPINTYCEMIKMW